MHRNRKINGGLPLIAIAFENHKDPSTFIYESNLKWKNNKKERPYENHAEWVLIEKNNLNKDNTKNMTLIITTTPCDPCAIKIKNETSFKRVFYLTNKFEDETNEWKDIKNIKLFTPIGETQSRLTKEMINHWEIANKENRKKTEKKKQKTI